MSRFRIFIVSIVLLLANPLHVAAWGSKGHAIVSEIAFSMLNDATKQNIQKYLGKLSPEDAGNWMDDIRDDHSFDYMKKWHYVNIAKGAEYVANDSPNIVNALQHAITKLQHRSNLSDDEIRQNLLIIMHLCGDMHMPLHVGYGDDRGGNTIHVSYNGRPSNLHRVWDTQIIESENITAADCLAVYKQKGPASFAKYKTLAITGWITEPRAQLGQVYDFPAGGEIDASYISKATPVVKQQLLIAGVRLAYVLDQLFHA